jgi:hypothetical protein
MGRAPREGRGSVGGTGRDGRSREILLQQCPAVAGEMGSRGPCANRMEFELLRSSEQAA